jgi:hypothetical protein
MKTSSGGGENEPDNFVSRAKRIAKALSSRRGGEVLFDVSVKKEETPMGELLSAVAEQQKSPVAAASTISPVPVPAEKGAGSSNTESSDSETTLAKLALPAIASPVHVKGREKREAAILQMQRTMESLVRSMDCSTKTFAALADSMALIARSVAETMAKK